MSSTQSIGVKTLDLEIDVAGSTRSLNTNLHLLDLDLDPRAAEITPLTFSSRDKAQNQGQRIRTAEWVLYRLFEIYDRKETQKRLQPFYPEIIQRQSQRQSLDLRAAIYKWLAELKQVGLLPKDMIVRKTMLDDCKGERFVKLIWELSCLALYVTVARNTHDKSVVKRMLVVSTETDIEARAAIGCAYRNCLSRVLEKKSVLATRYRDFGKVLDSNKAKLRAREKALENKSKLWKQKRLPESLLQRLELNLNEEWEGNLAWVDVLIHGDRHQPTNCLLEHPFEQVWPLVENGTVKDVQPQATQSLLQNLESRLEEQKARLEKWKVVQEDLAIASASPTKSPFKSPSKTPARTPSRTNRVISSRSNITPLHRRALSVEKLSRTAMSAVNSMSTTLEEIPRALELPPKITPLERTSTFRQPPKPSLISTRREPGAVSLDRNPKIPVGRLSSLRWPPNPEPAVHPSRDIPVDTKLTATKPQRAPSYQKHVRAESAPDIIKPLVSRRPSDTKTPQRVSSLRRPSPVKVTDKSIASNDGIDEKLKQGPMISRPINVNPATRSSVHMEEQEQIPLRDPRKLVSIDESKPISSLDEDDADLESLEMEVPSQIFSPSGSSLEGNLAELEKPAARATTTKADLAQFSSQSLDVGKMTENAKNAITSKHLLSLAERTRMSMSKSSPTRERLDPFKQLSSRSQLGSEPNDTNSHPSTHASTMPAVEPRSLAERTRMSMARSSPTKEKTNPLETQALEPDSAPTITSHASARLPYNSSSSAYTLAERTRLSIARLSPMKEVSNPFDRPLPTPITIDPPASTLSQPSTDPYLALQARTRLSLLESAAKAPQRRASMRKAARASRQYPVNQWDNEELPAAGSHARLGSVAEGTTGDAGFEDMDYESVFASRPKLGLGSSATELKRGEGSGLGKEGVDLDQVNALDEKSAFASRPRIGLGDGVN